MRQLSFKSHRFPADIIRHSVWLYARFTLAGARTILDILDAEQELLDAMVNLVRSQRDDIVAGVAVFSAIGRLTARDLKLAVDVYNPEIDYQSVRDRWFGLGISGEQ